MLLSAVVITYNEKKNIERCLKSVSFCDEIVVVDSGSTDGTEELAKKYTPLVHQIKWQGYADQKNAAGLLTKGEWILSLDADEQVSSELREELLSLVKTPGPYAAFSVPRRTIHSGKWIRHGGWYPNRLVRLFRRDAGVWVGGDVHEFVQVKGLVGELKNDLIHYSFDGISDQIERNNYYSSLGAAKLKKSGARFSLAGLLVKPVSKFLETYLLKCGFLDGYLGFVISVSAAYSVFLKWAKLWELENVEKG